MSPSPRQFALTVTQQLQDAGFQALWAGGCVRDELRGVSPADYDVATNATPDRIRQLFGYRRTLALGEAFGVITVIGPRSAGNIEIATFRSDGQYSDGRHPDAVTFGTAEMDAQRRDFTINGLFFDPVRETVIDYVRGQQDLENRLVRAIGDPVQRFEEDKLRMLRAIRFAATLDFQLDPQTLQAIQDLAPGIGWVSAERIAAELSRILLDEHRRRAVELLAASHLLTQAPLLPELQKVVDDSAGFERLLDRMGALSQPALPECIAALVCDVATATQVAGICARIRLPNLVRDTAVWILRSAETLGRAHVMPWSTVQPLLVDGRINNALRFVDACRAADQQSTAAIEFCHQRLAWPAEQLDPPRLIDGQSLQSLGVRPGPQYGEMLSAVRRKQLDGEIMTTGEAIDFVKSLRD